MYQLHDRLTMGLMRAESLIKYTKYKPDPRLIADMKKSIKALEGTSRGLREMAAVKSASLLIFFDFLRFSSIFFDFL